jgi:hypothetical protein
MNLELSDKLSKIQEELDMAHAHWFSIKDVSDDLHVLGYMAGLEYCLKVFKEDV